MSFLGLDYVYPAVIEAVQQERIIPLISGRVTGARFGILRWHVEIGLEPRRFGDSGSKMLSVHRAKYGITEPFTLLMPQLGTEVVVSHNQQRTAAAAVAGASSVSLDATVDVDLPDGRFIKFSGHSKVYQVDGAVTVTDAGVMVDIVPGLVANVVNNERWNATPNLRCRHDEAGGITISGRGIVSPVLSVTED